LIAAAHAVPGTGRIFMAELSMRRVKLSHRRMIYGNPRAIRYTDDRISSDSALILKLSDTMGSK